MINKIAAALIIGTIAPALAGPCPFGGWGQTVYWNERTRCGVQTYGATCGGFFGTTVTSMWIQVEAPICHNF
jgi:hypothetical protein